MKKTVSQKTNDRAYVAVVEGNGKHFLGIAVRGEAGYHKIPEDTDAGGEFATRERALGAAKAYNKSLGMSEREADEIVASTMNAQNREAAERHARKKAKKS